MLDQALDAAEAFGEREELAALEKALRRRQAAFEHRGDHAAVALAHLFRREQVLRMVGEPRVDDLRDLGMLLQERGDVHRVAAMALHAQRERLDPPQSKKRVEWTRHAAHGVL